MLTTNLRPAALPGNLTVPADVGALETHSVVNVTQLATLDRRALEQRVAALPDWLMTQTDSGLARALGLTRP